MQIEFQKKNSYLCDRIIMQVAFTIFQIFNSKIRKLKNINKFYYNKNKIKHKRKGLVWKYKDKKGKISNIWFEL